MVVKMLIQFDYFYSKDDTYQCNVDDSTDLQVELVESGEKLCYCADAFVRHVDAVRYLKNAMLTMMFVLRLIMKNEDI